MASIFYESIEFMDRLGVYDVVLPFLLVFVLMYAFLEKTKVYGVETYYLDEDKTKSIQGSRRNLNAMTAFVTGFFVVASTQLVAIINQALSHMVLLLLLVFCFMLVVGTFHKQEDEGFVLNKTWQGILTVVAAIVLFMIFLNALGWLDDIYAFILRARNSSAVAALVLVVIMGGLIALITSEPSPKKSGSEDG